MKPKRYIVWSTGEVDLDEVESLLDELDLPKPIDRLWRDFFEDRKKASG